MNKKNKVKTEVKTEVKTVCELCGEEHSLTEIVLKVYGTAKWEEQKVMACYDCIKSEQTTEIASEKVV